jgi:hypothetical protein
MYAGTIFQYPANLELVFDFPGVDGWLALSFNPVVKCMLMVPLVAHPHLSNFRMSRGKGPVTEGANGKVGATR